MAPSLQVTKQRAEELLIRQVEQGQVLLNRGQHVVTEELRLDGDSWSNKNKELLERLFDDPRYRSEYISAILANKARTTATDQHEAWLTGIKVRLNFVKGFLDRLDVIASETLAASSDAAVGSRPKVFVVHGHHDLAKRKLVQFLESRDFKPVLLSRRAGASRTLIEKIEDVDAIFAVVLLTGDDEGRKRPTMGARRPRLKPRARQNVVFEWGFFIGRLGRRKVRALYNPEVELPSDLAGVEWTPLDRRGAWREGLERELAEALNQQQSGTGKH